MWKRLRSWFSWRFSLGRLVVATVFLGILVGLNMRRIGPLAPYIPQQMAISVSSLPGVLKYYRGWPLPFMCEEQVAGFHVGWLDSSVASRSYRIPWTHRTYCLLHVESAADVADSEAGFAAVPAAIDTLVALIPFALILFLQIPRRREPSPPPPPPVRDGG